MRMTRQTRNIIKTILISVLLVGIVLGATAIFTRGDKFTPTEGLEVISPEFSRGALSATGEYKESNKSIYTETAFRCEGLKITKEFSKELKYQVFFYDEVDEFISVSPVYTKTAVVDVPEGAVYARVMVTPVIDAATDDGELSFLEARKLAGYVTIEVEPEAPAVTPEETVTDDTAA